MGQSAITDEIRASIGLETEAPLLEIDKTLIARLVEVIDDCDPNRQDGAPVDYDYSVAPPALFTTALARGNPAWEAIRHLLPARMLDGGAEWEFLAPVRLGDKLRIVNKLAEITESESRVGTMLVVTSEVTWRNQREEVVAKARTRLILY